MSRRRRPAWTSGAAFAVTLAFLASNVAGAFPAGSTCVGRDICLCCAGPEAECLCPPESSCGCRDAVSGQPSATELVVGIAVPLPAGIPPIPEPSPGRAGDSIPPEKVRPALTGPETPPP